MLNLFQRLHFSSLKDIYNETIAAKGLQYNQQQVDVVFILSYRLNIYKNSITKSRAHIPRGRGMLQP